MGGICDICQNPSTFSEPNPNISQRKISSSYNPVKPPFKNSQEQIKEYSDKFGLPNLSQTCYLNAALQLIFSMNILFTEQKTTFNTFLKDLFQILPSESNLKKKEKLQKIVDALSIKDSSIDFSKEEDMINVLNVLLNQLGQENPQIYKKFVLQYTTKCQCNERQTIFNPRFFTIDQVCGSCNKTRQVKNILSAPSFVLIKLNDLQKVPRQYITIAEKLRLELVAFSVFSRKKKHYMVVKKIEKKRSIIDDSHVYDFDMKSLNDYIGVLAVYKRHSD